LPKQPRLTAAELETRLLAAGFQMLRSKGSHRIYQRGTIRVVVPFHAAKSLHPKIIKQALKMIGTT
jgi:predicted RNA binding protein YcfA (HicA-like mRNA interferase family)